MDERARRQIEDIGPKSFLDWRLRLFFVGESPPSDYPRNIEEIERIVSRLNSGLDSAYTYLKKGFAIVHHGRRGVMTIIIHAGLWGDTFEIFSSEWYRLHSEIESAELGPTDPIMSIYEAGLIGCQLSQIYEHAGAYVDISEIMDRYLDA